MYESSHAESKGTVVMKQIKVNGWSSMAQI